MVARRSFPDSAIRMAGKIIRTCQLIEVRGNFCISLIRMRPNPSPDFGRIRFLKDFFPGHFISSLIYS